MSTHTPGPWSVAQASWNKKGDVRWTLDGIKHAHIADARLIAAAPDMLAALRGAAEAFDLEKLMSAEDFLARHAAILAAIAKAEHAA